MQGKLTPLVLVPRYTSYMGATNEQSGPSTTDYVSAPVDVTAYESTAFTVWRGVLAGTNTPEFRFYLEGSTDTVTWFAYPLDDITTPWVDPGANTGLALTMGLSYRWMRARVVLKGTNPAVTCWASGFVIDREDK